MLDRRSFLSSTLTGLTGFIAFRDDLLGQLEQIPTLPARALLDTDEDAFWAQMRRQFLIPPDEVYLNNGTVGSSPAPVLRAVFDSYLTTEKMEQVDPENYPIWGYGPFNEFRDPLAAFVGCSRDEIALVRNATEANNFIANGLDLKTGDEVVITDQEHPSGEQPWMLKAKRYGIVVKKVTLARPVKDAAQVLSVFNDALSPRTRVLFFSHVTSFSGQVLPAKELCAMARSKGILTAVDGAHVPGMMRLNLHDLGCDLYSASPHKWLLAPKGSGFLYVRDELIDRVWSTVTTDGWDNAKLRSERFQRLGSSNLPSLYGLRAAIELANTIGMDRIERRNRQLADYVLAKMIERGAESRASADASLRCGIVSVTVAPIQRMEIENWMWKNHRIRIRGHDPSQLRLSTPYYVQKKDLDRFVEAYDAYRKQKKA
jgi:selenocysteine lyase/cysteine desulfurase